MEYIAEPGANGEVAFEVKVAHGFKAEFFSQWFRPPRAGSDIIFSHHRAKPYKKHVGRIPACSNHKADLVVGPHFKTSRCRDTLVQVVVELSPCLRLFKKPDVISLDKISHQ